MTTLREKKEKKEETHPDNSPSRSKLHPHLFHLPPACPPNFAK
jgi:hypothetical protein